jgi:hypothetical protein
MPYLGVYFKKDVALFINRVGVGISGKETYDLRTGQGHGGHSSYFGVID